MLARLTKLGGQDLFELILMDEKDLDTDHGMDKIFISKDYKPELLGPKYVDEYRRSLPKPRSKFHR